MSSEFTVRKRAQTDGGRLKEIVDLSFPRFFRFFASLSIHEEEGQVLVTEANGVVVGFAKLKDFQVNRVKFGCILWLAVHPLFRRKGISGVLVKAGIENLVQKGAKAIFASVQRGNTASLAVFSLQEFIKMGFLGLWRFFGWRVFEFYRDIWFAPGEIVLMY